MTGFKSPAAGATGAPVPRVRAGGEEAREQGKRGSLKMADEAALALQPGGSPSALAAEWEAASPPSGEPLSKRPRRDVPGLGWSPGEPDGATAEREVLAVAGDGPAAAGGEREAPATAGGIGDNGPGLPGLSRDPPPADDFEDEEEDEEGEEEEEAAAEIGYRGTPDAGGGDCASPLLGVPGPLLVRGGAGGVWGGAWGLRAGSAAARSLPPLSAAGAPDCRPGCGSGRGLSPSRSPPRLPPSAAARAAWRSAQLPGCEALAACRVSFFSPPHLLVFRSC